MTQHFLLTANARTISLAGIMKMTDAEAEEMFAMIRWPATCGKPVCPKCCCDSSYDCRRPNGAPRWRCKKCCNC
ncbi:MAG: transposase, partial [Rhodospirillaceae bacterium]